MSVAELETYLTLQELADRQRVTVNTIRSRIKRGQAPRITKIGGKVLFAVSDVIAYERAARREASA
jgi:predicted DNA-binding transcriptional regulator AlpA